MQAHLMSWRRSFNPATLTEDILSGHI